MADVTWIMKKKVIELPTFLYQLTQSQKVLKKQNQKLTERILKY